MTQLKQQLNKKVTSGDTEQESLKATLLFVDDEANILSSLRRLFRSDKYKILTASGGQEGLEILEKEQVDLIISDMRMPGMDGASFLAIAAEKWPDTVRILLTGYSDITSTVDAINKGKIYKYISKPWEDNDILLSVRRALEQRFLQQERDRLLELTHKQNEELKSLNENLELKVKQRTAEIEQTMGMYEASNEALQQSYSSTIEIFSNLIAMRRSYSGSELRKNAELARGIAQALEQDDIQAQDVYYAELLRDIGQIGLQDALLSKPISTLSSAERTAVLKHAIIGQGILMALDPLQDVAQIIRCQYERFDGRGYPDKLAGSAIPMGARILTVLHDFYGLQNGSLTEKKFSAVEARDFIIKEKGKRYDPQVVEVFNKLVNFAETQSKSENVLLVKSNGLVPGMVLARDIVSEEGVLLLSTGYVITEEVIDRIDNFERSIDEDLSIFVVNKRS